MSWRANAVTFDLWHPRLTCWKAHPLSPNRQPFGFKEASSYHIRKSLCLSQVLHGPEQMDQVPRDNSWSIIFLSLESSHFGPQSKPLTTGGPARVLERIWFCNKHNESLDPQSILWCIPQVFLGSFTNQLTICNSSSGILKRSIIKQNQLEAESFHFLLVRLDSHRNHCHVPHPEGDLPFHTANIIT